MTRTRGSNRERRTARRPVEGPLLARLAISPPGSRSQHQVSTNPAANRSGDFSLSRVLVFAAHLRGAEPSAVARSELGPERDLDLRLGAVDSNAVARRAARTRGDFDVGPLRVSPRDVEVFVEDIFLNCLRAQGGGDVQRRLERGVRSRRCASGGREREERGDDGVDCFHVLRVGRAA